MPRLVAWPDGPKQRQGPMAAIHSGQIMPLDTTKLPLGFEDSVHVPDGTKALGRRLTLATLTGPCRTLARRDAEGRRLAPTALLGKGTETTDQCGRPAEIAGPRSLTRASRWPSET